MDNLTDFGRQNKVATLIGAQDRSQLVRDYGKKEPDVIFNTVRNLFADAVKGDTAADILPILSSSTCTPRRSAVKCKQDTRQFTMKIFQKQS